MRKIWKRTIVIYTDYDPEDIDIEDLSREAMTGNGHFVYRDEELDDPTADVTLTESEFFHQCLEQEDSDD